MIKEFCAENCTDLHLLAQQDIGRIELCDNMAQGGTTPSYGVIKEAIQFLHPLGITVATMIRPRGGDFLYNEREIAIMKEDMQIASNLKSDYLVLGCLTKDNQLDNQLLEKLIPFAKGTPLVFHMAFDLIPKEHQKQSLDDLVNLGFKRILMHGSMPRHNVLDNSKYLKELIDYANNRIEIMIGGGVTLDNYQELIAQTGVHAVHGTNLIQK